MRPSYSRLALVVVVVSMALAGADGAAAGGLMGEDPKNPLVGAAKDPFARAFKGDSIALALSGSSITGYTGTLLYEGATFPVKATSSGSRLEGTFEFQGAKFLFTAVLDGDKLRLESDGDVFDLAAEKEPAGAANPLARTAGPQPGGPGGPAGVPKPAPALEGVFAGPTTRFNHPGGWYSFELPKGWTVANQTDEGLLINPGFGPDDSLDAIIVVSHGTLDEAERGQPVNELVDRSVPEFCSGLADQGIEVEESQAKAAKVLVGEVPGAVLSFKGRTLDGKAVSVWFGGITKREYYLWVLGVVAQGRDKDFLPGVKRVFYSLDPKPPERNLAAEKALVGRSIGRDSSPSNGGGSFFTTYEFLAGGKVKKEMLISGLSGLDMVGGSSEEYGGFEVVGNLLYLYFKDGQETGTVLLENGRVAGVRMGGSTYQLR